MLGLVDLVGVSSGSETLTVGRGLGADVPDVQWKALPVLNLALCADGTTLRRIRVSGRGVKMSGAGPCTSLVDISSTEAH